MSKNNIYDNNLQNSLTESGRIGERLRVQRKSKKVTQKIVADALGIARSTYISYELGHVIPSRETLKKLAILYEIDENYFIDTVIGMADTGISQSSIAQVTAMTQKTPAVVKALALANEINALFLSGKMTQQEMKLVMDVVKTGYDAALNTAFENNVND